MLVVLRTCHVFLLKNEGIQLGSLLKLDFLISGSIEILVLVMRIDFGGAVFSCGW